MKMKIKFDKWLFAPAIGAGFMLGWIFGLLNSYFLIEDVPFWQYVLFNAILVGIGVWIFPTALSYLIYRILKKKGVFAKS